MASFAYDPNLDPPTPPPRLSSYLPSPSSLSLTALRTRLSTMSSSPSTSHQRPPIKTIYHPAPSPTLSYYTSAYIPPTPAAPLPSPFTTPRRAPTPPPPVPSLPANGMYGSPSGHGHGSPSSNASTPSRRKPPPTPLDLDLGRRPNIPGVRDPKDEIVIVTTVPSPLEPLTPTPAPPPKPAVTQPAKSRWIGLGVGGASSKKEKDKEKPKKEKGKGKAKAKAQEEECWAEVEPGHRYPSWMGGTDVIMIGGSTDTNIDICTTTQPHHHRATRSPADAPESCSPSPSTTPTSKADVSASYDYADVFMDTGDLGVGGRNHLYPSPSAYSDSHQSHSHPHSHSHQNPQTQPLNIQHRNATELLRSNTLTSQLTHNPDHPSGGDVLHNILLTPTYAPSTGSRSPGAGAGWMYEGRRRLINPLAASPEKAGNSSRDDSWGLGGGGGKGGAGEGGGRKKEKRQTLLDKAARILADRRLHFIEARNGLEGRQGAGVASVEGKTYVTQPGSAGRREAMEMGVLYDVGDGSPRSHGKGGKLASEKNSKKAKGGLSLEELMRQEERREEVKWKVAGAFGVGGMHYPDGGHGRKEKRAAKVKDGMLGIGKMKSKIKRVHMFMAIAAIVIGLLIIAICTSVLLTKSSSSSTTASSSSNTTSTSTTSSSSLGTDTVSAATSTSTVTAAYTIDSCLALFASSASSSPLTYPCSSCVPLLTTTTDDFASSTSGAGNSTGVGATLQFCALQVIYQDAGGSSGSSSTSSSAAAASATATPGSKRRGEARYEERASNSELTGWMADASPCNGWSGVSCDSEGRITTLTLTYPAIPSTLDSSLANIIGLTTLKITGNSAIPSGAFPSSIFTLPSLTSVDIESTALTGSLDASTFDSASKLQTLILVSNAKLGTELPSLYGASVLSTVTVTGQSLTSIPSDLSTSTLSYLDLSFNSLTGAVPDTSSFSLLNTLYLESNSFTSLPTAFAPNLTSLSLQDNDGLTGTLPSSLCSSSALKSCSLKDTLLQYSMETNKTAISFATVTTTSGTATIQTYAAQTSISTVAASCGVCAFS